MLWLILWQCQGQRKNAENSCLNFKLSLFQLNFVINFTRSNKKFGVSINTLTPGPNVIKLFTSVICEIWYKARVYVRSKPFQSGANVKNFLRSVIC
jgi:hypothetical protein